MDVLEQFKVAYDIHPWLRYITWCVLVGGALLLLWVSGGFPPHAWHLLAQALPQVPRLFASRGFTVLLSLGAVGLLSLTWVVLWVTLLGISIALLRRWWQRQHLPPTSKAGWKRTTAPLPPVPTLEQGETIQPEERRGAIHHAPTQGRTSFDEKERDRAIIDEAISEVRAQFIAPQERSVGVPFIKKYAGERATDGMEMLQASPRPITRNGRVEHATPALSLEASVGWNVGISRKHKPNEDSLAAIRGTCTRNDQLLTFGLFVVADGMGGHADGREASRLAIHCMLQSVLPTIMEGSEGGGKLLMETLVDGVRRANQAVYQRNQEYLLDMGTTIAAALVLDTTAYIVNVGDSRTYLYRPDAGLRQITRDHSVVARLVEEGKIAAEDIYTHPQRNQVYRGLGDKPHIEVDAFTVSLQEGGFLLLCSDGLWEMVRDHELARILERYGTDPSQASTALVEAALQGGGADNISGIVVHVLNGVQAHSNFQGISQFQTITRPRLQASG